LILQIVKKWVKQLTSQKGYPEQIVEKANAVLFTFGSYRLGVIPSSSFSFIPYTLSLLAQLVIILIILDSY
jgi:poly(A) polymerase Pap1